MFAQFPEEDAAILPSSAEVCVDFASEYSLQVVVTSALDAVLYSSYPLFHDRYMLKGSLKLG